MLQCLGLSSRPERHGDFAPLRKSLARSGGIPREYPLQCRFREFSPDRQPHTLSALNTVAPSQITALPTAIFHQAVTGTEHGANFLRSEEHTSELQSHLNLVCRLLLEKKKK